MIGLPHLILSLLGFMVGMIVALVALAIDPRLWFAGIGLALIAMLVIYNKAFPARKPSGNPHQPVA
jgi:hypothetical protein